jgi:uncharacterized protein YuzE
MELPAARKWIDHDEETDVLYLNYWRPQRADDSELRDDGIILHRRRKNIVGMKILEASQR